MCLRVGGLVFLGLQTQSKTPHVNDGKRGAPDAVLLERHPSPTLGGGVLGKKWGGGERCHTHSLDLQLPGPLSLAAASGAPAAFPDTA